MGFGQVLGGVPSVWYYFRPQDGNPYVLAFVGTILLLSIAFAYWVLVADGARKVIEFQLADLMGWRGIKLTEGRVKLFAAAGPFFVLLWVYLAASMDAPIPK
jgi:hypothetical protein